MTQKTNKMYAIKNVKENTYLNYASKRKKWFSKGFVGHSVSSPFPTLRPKEHIEKYFNKWINNTCEPENYILVEFEENELLDLEDEDVKKE